MIIPCNFNILSWLKIVVEEEIHVDVFREIGGRIEKRSSICCFTGKEKERGGEL